MIEKKNISTATHSHSDYPCLIMDKSGRIIALNLQVKRIIPSISAQSNFFEFFEAQMQKNIQKLFVESRKYDIPVKDVFEFNLGKEFKKYEVNFIPLKSENNTYFLISFHTSGDINKETETKKFWIASSEIEKITSDKKILSVLNKIKVTYPFTFIEKAKIQKEINELESYFWIKESGGKYIIVNEVFAGSLGMRAAQIENKNEEDFLPKYLIQLYNTIDSFIIQTTNTVVLEGLATPAAAGNKSEFQIIEFPICDLDNKVVAIIGFSIKTSGSSSKGTGINPALYESFPLPVLQLDRDNLIAGYSSELAKLLLLNENIDYLQKDLSQMFDKKLSGLIHEKLKENSEQVNESFTYIFVEKGNLKVEIKLNRLFENKNNYLGAQLLFIVKDGFLEIQESKAELYDSIIHNSPEAMYIYDLENLKFLEVNDFALKLYGYKRQDFLNMDLTDLYAPEDIQTLITSSDKTANANLIGPWRHKKSDGSNILVELTRTSVSFFGKKAHLNIIKNVTESAVEKKELQILKAAYENSNDLIIITDKEGFISGSNEHITKVLGFSKKELENRPFVSLVIDEDRGKVNKNIFHSGLLKPTSVEINIKKPSSNIQKANLIATPIKNYEGNIDAYILIIKIIEDKTPVKDIKHAPGESVEKVDPPFLSNMFHEILTPINVIMGFTQELGESLDEPSDEQIEALEIIKENQKLLLQIMDNAVEYSTLNEKVVRFQPEEIKFVEIIEELKESTRKTAESKKVEVNYDNFSPTVIVESDKQKLISLLSLFIKISIQITKENSIYLSVVQIDNDNFSFAVKDSINEITPFLLKGFHDVFSDDESVSRRNYGFSRFSIRLANRLFELLSVKKEIIKKEDKPVEFALVFPKKFVIADKEKMEIETKKVVPDAKPASKKQIIQQTEENMPVIPKQVKELDVTQLSCMYLEDQVDSQILFETQMKDLKSIEFAPSFETALPLLKTKRFDFILMDMNLQGEYNGLDALRIIQKMPGYKDIPIIASTAYVQPGAKDNFKAAGFTDFISKPLLRDKILESLRNIFS